MFFMPILYSFFPLFFCQFVLLQNTVREKKKKSIKMPLRFKINMLLKSLELFSTLTVVVIQSYTHDKTAPIHTLKWLQQHWWNLNGISGWHKRQHPSCDTALKSRKMLPSGKAWGKIHRTRPHYHFLLQLCVNLQLTQNIKTLWP